VREDSIADSIFPLFKEHDQEAAGEILSFVQDRSLLQIVLHGGERKRL
jgi:hypothetical protein